MDSRHKFVYTCLIAPTSLRNTSIVLATTGFWRSPSPHNVSARGSNGPGVLLVTIAVPTQREFASRDMHKHTWQKVLSLRTLLKSVGQYHSNKQTSHDTISCETLLLLRDHDHVYRRHLACVHNPLRRPT